MASRVIFAGSGDSAYRASEFQLIQGIKSLRKFEVSADGTLCSKEAEGFYIIVRKSFPPLRKQRFREHLIKLYEKYRSTQSFQFSELVPKEFEHELDDMQKTAQSVIFRGTTRVCFTPGIKMTLDLPGVPLEVNYEGTRLKRSEDLTKMLFQFPVGRINKQDQIISTMASFTPPNDSIEIGYIPKSQTQIELNQSANALRVVKEYLALRDSQIDTALEKLLTDPNSDELKKNRSTTSMHQAKESNPDLYSFYQGLYEDYKRDSSRTDIAELTEKFERANLSTTYGFFITVSDGKRLLNFSIP